MVCMQYYTHTYVYVYVYVQNKEKFKLEMMALTEEKVMIKTYRPKSLTQVLKLDCRFEFETLAQRVKRNTTMCFVIHLGNIFILSNIIYGLKFSFEDSKTTLENNLKNVPKVSAADFVQLLLVAFHSSRFNSETT